MNLLMLLTVSFTIILTLLGIKTYRDSQKVWKEIEMKAACSPYLELDVFLQNDNFDTF